MALTQPVGSCKHGIDFTSRCADCANELAQSDAKREQSVRDKRAQFVRHMVLAQAHGGQVRSEAEAVTAIFVAEQAWKALEERGYA